MDISSLGSRPPSRSATPVVEPLPTESLPPPPPPPPPAQEDESDDEFLAGLSDEDLEIFDDQTTTQTTQTTQMFQTNLTEEQKAAIVLKAERLQAFYKRARAANRESTHEFESEKEEQDRAEFALSFPDKPHIRLGNMVWVKQVINENKKEMRSGPAKIVNITYSEQTVDVKFSDYNRELTATFKNVDPMPSATGKRRAAVDAFRSIQAEQKLDREHKAAIEAYGKSSSSSSTAKRQQPSSSSSSSSSSSTSTTMQVSRTKKFKGPSTGAIPNLPNPVNPIDDDGEEEEEEKGIASSQDSTTSTSSAAMFQALFSTNAVPSPVPPGAKVAKAFKETRPKGRPRKDNSQLTRTGSFGSIGSLGSSGVTRFMEEVEVTLSDITDSPGTSSSTTTTKTTTVTELRDAEFNVDNTPPPPPPGTGPSPVSDESSKPKRERRKTADVMQYQENKERGKVRRSNDLSYKTVMNCEHTVRQRVAAMCAMHDVALGPKSVEGWEAQYFRSFPTVKEEVAALIDNLASGNADAKAKVKKINEDFWTDFVEVYGIDPTAVPESYKLPRARFNMSVSIRLDVNAEFKNSQFEKLVEAGYLPFVEVPRAGAGAGEDDDDDDEMTYADLIEVVKSTWRIPNVLVVLTEVVFDKREQEESAKYRRSEKRTIVEGTAAAGETLKPVSSYRFHWQPRGEEEE